MTRVWRFTDLEFVVLWETLKEDMLPRPLSFVSRTPHYDDFIREKHEARERLRSRLDSGFDEVLSAIARPDVRVQASGWDHRGSEDPKGRIRLHAGRAGDHAYLVEQVPGETIRHSGGFTITEHPSLKLADLVVNRLPDIPAGSQADVALPDRIEDGGVDYRYRRSSVEHLLDEDPLELRRDTFLSTPTSGMGRIDIVQGVSRFGPRGITRRQLYWRDLSGDGRYAISGENPPTARGVDSNKLIATINARIAEIIRAIKDEHV